jgi:PPP family 3-phenylpropionic acid transporter
MFVYYKELGLSGQQVGWLASLSPLSMVLFATSIAALADRKRWRVGVLRTALVCYGTLLFFLRFPTTFNGLLALMLPMAICHSPIMSISTGLIARMARRYNLNYGGIRLWGSFGFATSALIFGAIWQRLDFKWMFLVASMLYLPLIFMAGKLEEGPIKKEEDRKPLGELFRDAGLVMLLAGTFLAAISNSLSMTFEGILVRSLGGGNFLIGVMIACAAFIELPTMFYSHRIAQRIRGTNTIILAYAFSAAAFLGFMLVKDPNLLPFFSIMKGIGYGLNYPSAVRILTERTPDEWASTAQSLFTICWMGLAPLIAGPLGGLIHDAISPAAVFGLGVLTLGLAAIVLRLASMLGKLD